jgi:hypothetical protein
MAAKPTYAELEKRIRILEETAKGEWMQAAVDASGDAIGVSTAVKGSSLLLTHLRISDPVNP